MTAYEQYRKAWHRYDAVVRMGRKDPGAGPALRAAVRKMAAERKGGK